MQKLHIIFISQIRSLIHMIIHAMSEEWGGGGGGGGETDLTGTAEIVEKSA